MDALLNNLFGVIILGGVFYILFRKVFKGGCCSHSQSQCNDEAQRCESPSDNMKQS